MGFETSLEEYLKSADIDRVLDLPGGGGHSEKSTLVLRGGVTVAAKPGHDPEAALQAANEVAASHVARELGMGDLVPMTVHREVPGPNGGMVEGSAQVLWPRFVLAQGNFTPAQCPNDVAWRIAVFDVVVANTDRNDGNWGAIGGLPDAVLIDHGHCFTKANNCTSPFFIARQDQPVPADLLASVEEFSNNSSSSRILTVLGAPYVQQTFERAQHLVDTGLLALS